MGIINEQQLIQVVWNKARLFGSVSYVVRNAINSFSLLTKQNGKGFEFHGWLS